LILTWSLWDQYESNGHQSDEKELGVDRGQVAILGDGDLKRDGSREPTHTKPKVVGGDQSTWKSAPILNY